MAAIEDFLNATRLGSLFVSLKHRRRNEAVRSPRAAASQAIVWACFASLLTGALVAPAAASEKKGIALYEQDADDRIQALNVAWYYTWRPKPVVNAPPEKFVPMLWGGADWDRQYAQVKSLGKVPALLVANEPDVERQATMSVEEVVSRWKSLSGLAGRLSSPAAANPFGKWFAKFNEMAEEQGLQVDFMAVHLYTKPDPAEFLSKLDAIYRRYRKPIWITEFAVADWSSRAGRCSQDCVNKYDEEDVLQFLKVVLPELEKRKFVERYSWYSAGRKTAKYEELRTSSLFTPDGKLTRVGCYYAQFQWPAPKSAMDCNRVSVR
ncbi:glycosyl hydrolase [Methylobacterium sp. Leaf118]|uniref:glycosyl hydrolase n=1 Tax=Methylobacterium sp. Leaf118 TaxID=2876562 RepID=UPI001E496B4B|nr:glycosyl hydrolase [Methylobacterium sp. Leaf118]